MKLNCNCVRDVLLQLEELLVCEQSNGSFFVKTVKLDKLTEKLSGKYNNSEILYTVCKLEEENYINAKIIDANRQIVYCEIFKITNEGHTFLDTIRP
ncbi:MAG: DUF2513 domain-containing protein, partial [Lachnospiraceae bacterium]|nr:DUF2513 domain-containing protein [Lachnospiraceae bacterium]